jgi:hypothetical protein
MSVTRRDDAPSRSVTEVGPGDYIKIGSHWKRIHENSAQGSRAPRNWTILTEDGMAFGEWRINRFAKAEDMRPRS